MIRELTVDSSVFLSAFIGDEKYSSESHKFFDQLREMQVSISIPVHVLMETVHAFFRVTKNRVLTEKLYQYFMDLNMDKILSIHALESEYMLKFMDEHFNFDCKTADTMVVIHALKQNSILITWDKDLITASVGKIQAFTPSEFCLRS